MKRAHIAVECYATDCYEPSRLMIKLHRRNEPLLSTPDFGCCKDHFAEALELAGEQLLEGDECFGISIMLP